MLSDDKKRKLYDLTGTHSILLFMIRFFIAFTRKITSHHVMKRTIKLRNMIGSTSNGPQQPQQKNSRGKDYQYVYEGGAQVIIKISFYQKSHSNYQIFDFVINE